MTQHEWEMVLLILLSFRLVTNSVQVLVMSVLSKLVWMASVEVPGEMCSYCATDDLYQTVL